MHSDIGISLGASLWHNLDQTHTHITRAHTLTFLGFDIRIMHTDI